MRANSQQAGTDDNLLTDFILFLTILWKHWKLIRTFGIFKDQLTLTIKAIFVGMLVIELTLGMLS